MQMRSRVVKLTLLGGLAAVVVVSAMAATFIFPRPSKAVASAPVTDLTMLQGGTSAGASSINDAGDIVGAGDSALHPGQDHAILWTGGVPKDLGTLMGGTTSHATGINNVNVIVGNSDGGQYGQDLVLWKQDQNGVYQANDILVPSGATNTSAVGINDQELVIGQATVVDPVTNVEHWYGFTWKAGIFTPLTVPSRYDYCLPSGLNNLGAIVGVCTSADQSLRQAYVWQSPEDTTPLPLKVLPGGSFDEVHGINDRGEMVGDSSNDSSPFGHPVFWASVTADPIDLGYPLPPTTPQCYCGALGINNQHQIVGTSRGDGWQWATGAPPATLLPRIANCTVNAIWPLAINNVGQAVGVTWCTDGDHPTEWTVTPPSPQQQIQAISTQVQTLITSGTLTSGEGAALEVKLQAASASLSRSGGTSTGNTTAACHQLQAFVNQVQADVRSGRLTQAQSQSLLSATSTITTRLCK